ncbi:aspartate kinase [bacterium endosymbiont of Pedicinus badii]|uniref:aspartate kinase n=1 Tax=bacterium endosymbiont of Pedicinus badii TaxID=1719126 RepID=UPI0009CC1058|nr:aspartate kinase [bacterium endosymbiont of Pedicinus badii]OQM34132.1 hypothetical protein AOQ89_02195 [bacterium endosymbiont of Pedicinus badii]
MKKKNMEIAKFGGKSISNIKLIDTAIKIVVKNNIKVIVLSAFSNTTELLISLAKEKNKKNFYNFFTKIENIQYRIIKFLKNKRKIEKKVSKIIRKIKKLAKYLVFKFEKSKYQQLLSYGEIISTLVFAERLRQKKKKIKWFDIRNVLYTKMEFYENIPIDKIIKKKIKKISEILKKGYTIVTQGFIAKDINTKCTTLLGRGSSDYTAALLGKFLQFKKISIWKDVVGVHKIDPKIAKNKNIIRKINYRFIKDMSFFGANIVHEKAVGTIMKNRIILYINSITHPKKIGTIVCNNAKFSNAIAIRTEQILLKIFIKNILQIRYVLNSVVNILFKNFIFFDFLVFSKKILYIVIDSKKKQIFIDDLDLEKIFKKMKIYNIEIIKNLFLITIIGKNTKKIKDLFFYKIIKKFKIETLFFGRSKKNFCILSNRKESDFLVKQICKVFIF